MKKEVENFFKNSKNLEFETFIKDLKSEFKVDLPDKYVFKVEGSTKNIAEIFEMYNYLHLDGLYEKIKYLKNLEGFTIDKREFFSIARKFYRDKDEVEDVRLIEKIRRKGEDLNEVLRQRGFLVMNEENVNTSDYDLEIDFWQSLESEVLKTIDTKAEEEKFVDFISSAKVDEFDFYDAEREKEKIIIQFDILEYEPKEIFDLVKTNPNLFYMRMVYEDQNFVKIYKNDLTKKVLTDKMINKKSEDHKIYMKYYPLNTTKEYVLKAIVDIELDLYTGTTELKFKSYKGINTNATKDAIFSELSFLKRHSESSIPDTTVMIINGFTIERNVFIYILFKYFSQVVQIDESKTPFAFGTWTRFYLRYKKNKISFTINNDELEQAITVRKEGMKTKIPEESNIVRITIAKCETKENLEIAKQMFYKALSLYVSVYDIVARRFEGIRPYVKPLKMETKIKSLKEIIPGFEEGDLSKQAKKDELILNILTKEEAERFIEEGDQVMLFPPPNMRKLFKIHIKEVYIGPGPTQAPYIGLKENTTKIGSMNKDVLPYIPKYYTEEHVIIDKDFNVQMINMSSRNIDKRKKKKVLLPGETGDVNADIIRLMGVEGEVYTVGFPRDDNFSRAIASIDDEEFIRFNANIPSYAMQELYDQVSVPGIAQYETHCSIFEKIKNANIYVFEMIEKNITLVIPRHKDFYVPDLKLKPSCIVLFRNKSGLYELIRRPKTCLFDEKVNKRLSDIMVYITQIRNLKVFNIYDYYKNIIGQTININGKLESICVKDGSDKYTIFTPPLHPLDVKIIEEIFPLPFIPSDSKRDKKALGIEFKIDEHYFRAYCEKDISKLPIDESLFFEDLKQKSIIDPYAKIKARCLKQIFGIFLLQTKDKNFVDNYCVVKPNHEYLVEYSKKEVETLDEVPLPSYVKGGKIILSSYTMEEKFKKLADLLLKQQRENTINLLPGPYVFKKRYFNISDFEISSKNEFIFMNLETARLFMYEKRTEMDNKVFTTLPNIIAARYEVKKSKATVRNFKKIKEGSLVYPSKYNLPVDPILYSDGTSEYWIQYVKDTQHEVEQIDAVKAIIYNWEKVSVNTGYYTNRLVDGTINPFYATIEPLINTIKPNGKSCILKYVPSPTTKIKTPSAKYAAVLKI